MKVPTLPSPRCKEPPSPGPRPPHFPSQDTDHGYKPFFQEKFPLLPRSGLHLRWSKQGVQNISNMVLNIWVIRCPPEGSAKASPAHVQSPFRSLRSRGPDNSALSGGFCTLITYKQTSRKRHIHVPGANNKFHISCSRSPFFERSQVSSKSVTTST